MRVPRGAQPLVVVEAEDVAPAVPTAVPAVVPVVPVVLAAEVPVVLAAVVAAVIAAAVVAPDVTFMEQHPAGHPKGGLLCIGRSCIKRVCSFKRSVGAMHRDD